MKIRKSITAFLFTLFILILFPIMVSAEPGGDFIVTTDEILGTDYTYISGILTINNPGEYRISMTTPGAITTTDRIVVTGGTEADPVNINLESVSIDLPASGGSAFNMTGATVNLTLVSDSSLKSGEGYAGLQCPNEAALTIDGTGTLTTTGGDYAAGIGGGFREEGGTVVINGGTVNATAGPHGGAGIGGGGYFGIVGIGGGSDGNGGNTTINGGIVNAIGGSGYYGGAGIGGGCSGNGGNITINGGTILAVGGRGYHSAAGIGGGEAGAGGTVEINGGTITTTGIGGGGYSAVSGTCTIKGGSINASSIQATPTNGSAPVYLTTITLQGVSSKTAITSMDVIPEYVYGLKDVFTDNTGKIYFYLPENTDALQARTADTIYNNDGSDNFIADTNKPTVIGVLPSDKGTAVNGSIVVTFNEEMRIETGNVSLDGGANSLPAGAWSKNNTVYTTTYSRLAYLTAYMVSISGFKDYSGNEMDTSEDNTFITRNRSSGYGIHANSYIINSSASAGGSIYPSGEVYISPGEDKTYTITAERGYAISDVQVDGVSVGAASTYTFENLNKSHIISASFMLIHPFTDLKLDDWYFEDVLSIHRLGLMLGTSYDTFSPNAGMTRAMYVTVLHRLNGDMESFINTFLDVPSGIWYEQGVAWAGVKGIVKGIGGGMFAPDEDITREQLAVMLYNYAKVKGYDVSIGEETNILSYGDTFSISDYAYAGLQWACGAGVIKGYPNGDLHPNDITTRAEVGAILGRFILWSADHVKD
jgi:hypothetical protein